MLYIDFKLDFFLLFYLENKIFVLCVIQSFIFQTINKTHVNMTNDLNLHRTGGKIEKLCVDL